MSRRRAVITRTTPPEVPYTGRIIIADNFREGAQVWEAHPSFPNTGLYWQGIYVLSGWRALCVQDDSSSPAAGTVTLGLRKAPAITSGKVAVQIAFMYPSSDATQYLYFIFVNVASKHWGAIYDIAMYDHEYSVYDSSARKLKELGLRYSVAAKWQYLDQSLNWVDIPGGIQELDPLTWHRLTVRLDFGPPDFDVPHYVEFNCDGMERDMQQLIGYTEDTDEARPHFEVQVGSMNRSTLASSLYIDDVIVVEGEV